MKSSKGILRVAGPDHSFGESGKLNWSDEQAVQYQIAINDLHNYSIGKTIPEMPKGITATHKKKSLKFAKQIRIEN